MSYLPTVEKTAATGDTNNLVVTIDGLFSSGDPQPSAVQISLTGYGTDRHVALVDSPIAFPATYRNLSDADAPVQAVTVENTGEAPLEVTGVMLTGDAVFTLLDDQPTTIAGGGSAQFRVRFEPTNDAGTFTGTLALMHDDEDFSTPRMAAVPISGTGAARPVTLSQNTLDLGVTGVGVPIKLSDKQPAGIQLINMSSTDSFTVREVQLTGDTGQFQLINTAGATLDPNGHAQYDIEFAPDHAGDFSVTMQVFLDDDPEVQTSLTITGTAVDVRVRGGGCDAGGGGGGWGALVLLALAAIGLRRRARAAAAGALALALVLGARPAAAGGPTRDVDLSTFSPAPATEPQGLELEGAAVGVPGAWALELALNYATNPLHVESPQITGMVDQPITSRTAADLDFAYAFLGRFEAGVRLPLLEQAGQAPQFSGLTPADGLALGDAALHGKAALLAAGPVALSGSATLTLPTATSGQFAGSPGVTARLNGILGFATGRIGATLNVGFRVQGSARLGDIEQGNALTYGAGGSYRVLAAVSVVGELYGQYGVGSPSTAGVSPLEVAIGGRYRMSSGLGVGAGLGRGLMPGIGSPDVRAFLLLSYAPRARAPEPLPVAHSELPRPRDTGDDDGDGIVNSDDKCPTDAEDKDGFQDEDGCPDADNDGDGIPDSVDKCPNVAEDKDGFQDEDGCPDEDNDKDGIPDKLDKCPNEPEDKDGFQDNDGCDDPDNDHDGIPDVVDQCATEPETINGNKDDDGCPDPGESLVMVMADRIEVFEPVRFRGLTARLDRRSTKVLTQVAETLRANREFKRVRITVHVQARGGSDQDLSEKRAEAVRAWLVKWGVEPERIEARGFGSSRLLVPRKQKGAAKINDRVEFIIMEKK